MTRPHHGTLPPQAGQSRNPGSHMIRRLVTPLASRVFDAPATVGAHVDRLLVLTVAALVVGLLGTLPLIALSLAGGGLILWGMSSVSEDDDDDDQRPPIAINDAVKLASILLAIMAGARYFFGPL